MARILIVEDEAFVANLLKTILTNAGHETVHVMDGQAAWELLQRTDDFELFLLDRQLPGLDGMDLLRRIKASDPLKNVPVIMETGLSDSESVLEGLNAGAYYYLTKPVHAKLLLAVVQSALESVQNLELLQASVRDTRSMLGYLDNAELSFRTLDESRLVAQGLSLAFPDPKRVVMGLTELLVNAVEHGNLGISYKEKTQLMLDSKWREEVERRLHDEKYAKRRVTVQMRRLPACLKLRIQDEGEGFDWAKYESFSPERAFDPHGRGIAMAKMVSFDRIAYQGNGNTVDVEVAVGIAVE